MCDVPVIAKETLQFEFLENTTPFVINKNTSLSTTNVQFGSTSTPTENGKLATFDDKTSSPKKGTNTSPTTSKWWWRTEKKNILSKKKEVEQKFVFRLLTFVSVVIIYI